MSAPIEAEKVPGMARPVRTSSNGAAAAVFLLVGGMIAAGWYASDGARLILITLQMLLLMLVIGRNMTGQTLGVLINERNLMSLSRFQMAVWTLLVIAVYFSFAFARMKEGVPDPLNIQIDWHLWALLGISTTSLIGTPAILTNIQNKDPDQSAIKKASAMVNEPAAQIEANRDGALYANQSMADARFTDMFEGDELANTGHLDFAKLQMFYFTVIAAVTFFVMVLALFAKPNLDAARDLEHLPLLPDGLVAILGISNAGYLSSKAVVRTKVKSPPINSNT